jgi:hypothetical protein
VCRTLFEDGQVVSVPPAEAVLDAVNAAQQLRARGRGGRHPDTLGDELIRIRRACNLLELEFAAVAAEFASTDVWEREGNYSPMHWIRHNCNVTGFAASSALAVGEQAGFLPATVEALDKGEIGFAHLAHMARTSAAVRESPSAAPFDERRLLNKAVGHTVHRFADDCAHYRHAADAGAVLDEHNALVEARRLELMPRSDGAVFLRGFLDPAGGAALRTALEPLAGRRGEDDLRRRDRRLGDAIVELANLMLDAGTLPQRGGQRPHLQVTATVETLLGAPGAPGGDMEFSTPVPAATVQRIACDAALTRVLMSAESVVTDVGRTMRIPNASTRRALRSRDKGCVWPRCDRTATFTAAHHLQHWAHGGATDLSNLVLLCHAHHWRVHEGGWTLVRGEGGGLMAIPALHENVHRAREPAPDAVA